MILRKYIRLIGATCGLVLGTFIVITAIDVNGDLDRVAYILNIPSAPKSLRVESCESPNIWTDIVISCSIELEAHDFTKLLVGYNYTKSNINGTSYSVIHEEIGSEFPVITKYAAYPASFEHGGSVEIFTNREKTRAIIELYIE